MTTYPFPHDSAILKITTETHEIALYRRNGEHFKRSRDMTRQEWQDTVEEKVDREYFQYLVACAELAAFTRG